MSDYILLLTILNSFVVLVHTVIQFSVLITAACIQDEMVKNGNVMRRISSRLLDVGREQSDDQSSKFTDESDKSST